MTFEVVCCIRLKDSVARHHLIPIAANPLVSRLWVIRRDKLSLGAIPKVEYVLLPGRSGMWRFARMIWHAIRLGRRRQVKAFVSFNPIPYGLFSFLAGRLCGKAVHFGFIGTDWNVHTKHQWWSRLLMPVFRRAHFVTVPGETMRREMLSHGFEQDRVTVSPHGTDLARFPVADTRVAEYACVFVGELYAAKQVDVLLDGWSKVIQEHPEARFCVVGDGQDRARLEQQAKTLGIAEAVNFVGLVENVYPYLAKSRILTMGSTAEGFPSAMVEAMCTGLVPISTPVGCIPDVITDGHNGLLFPVGDSHALAQCILRLLNDQPLYDRLRDNVL